MAKAKTDATAEPTSVEAVEVEYVLGDKNVTIFIGGTQVAFAEGKATVTSDLAAKLKESELIK